MKYLLSLCCLLALSPLFGQNGDCATALSVCSDFYDVDTSPAGTGNVFEMAPGSCQTAGEFNSAWYVFTAQESGLFSFTLVPNNLNDDYDWSLFNITDNGCAGINNGQSPEVSCNSYGLFGGIQGPTGISSAEGGSGNSNGPGDLLGPPFNADLPVTAGQTFALVVMNYSATLNGYELDFTQSDVSIFDEEPPAITDIDFGCDQTQFTIHLSEACLTDNMAPANITFSLDGVPYDASTAAFGTGAVAVFDVVVDGLEGMSGTVTIGFTDAITDICGNPLPLTYSFVLPGSPTLTLSAAPSCDGADGSIEATATGGAGECFSFSLNGSSVGDDDCTSATLDGLAPGTYTVEVTGDLSDCPVEETITVTDIPLEIDAGMDTVLCDMNTPLEATFSGGDFAWEPLGGITFTNPTSAQSLAIADLPGEYILTATVTSGDCSISDGVTITFNYPPQLELVVTHESCAGYCDGSVQIANAQGSISATLNDTFLQGESLLFDGLCDGSYTATVVISPECTADYEVVIEGPVPAIAEFDANPWVTTVNNTVIQLTNTSTDADSVWWQVFHDPSLNTSLDAWTLVLPSILGVYPIAITAFGENGCATTFLGNIVVEDDFQVYVPSAFTPDFDGINDVFLPQFSYEPERYELVIFDRWGEVIFRSDDPQQAWTGAVHGGEYSARDGIYPWLLTVKGKEVEELEFSGHVVLLR